MTDLHGKQLFEPSGDALRVSLIASALCGRVQR